MNTDGCGGIIIVKTITTKENNAMKNKYKPYMIDIKYEFKTYQHVGKDYGNSKSADLGCLFNFRRFVRKTWNRKQNKYKFCNTFSDWKEHITSVLNKNIVNYDDMIHWLIYERNFAKQYLESIKAILIPIYIAFIGVFSLFLNEEDNPLCVLISIMLLIIAISVHVLHDATEKVDFFEDCIQIANEIRRP